MDSRRTTGGAGRDRTDDPLLAKQVLSQLSYSPRVAAPRRMQNEECRMKNSEGALTFCILHFAFNSWWA